MAHSTWISSITNSTLNMTPSTYSFQDALSPVGITAGYWSSYPYLFQNACTQEDGSQNCTASCQDPNKAFASLDTLHNCIVYPTVADLYARNNLSNTRLPEDYNIPKAKVNSSVYNNITTTIQTCLIDFCNATPGCKDGLNQTDNYDMSSSPSNLTSTFYLYDSDASSSEYNAFDFCDYIPASFNPDIGGIGVYISYWIQTGFALLSFLLVVWWNWGLFYVCLGALLLPRGYSQAKRVAQRIRNESRNKHLPSLTGALAEFQKAQCFFMLAINIAALVNRNNGGFQPNNLQELYNTYILIKSISISGYLPVTFTIFTLHLVDVVSWYLLVLSVVTVFVSIATLFVIGNFSPSQDDLDFLSQKALSGAPSSCGTTNLAVYCYKSIGEYGSTDPASGAYSMLAFCLVVLILLVAHQSHAFKDPSTGQTKPWLSKALNAFFRKYEYNLSLRKVQIVLSLISIGLNGYVVNLGGIQDERYINGYYYGVDSFSTRGTCEFALFASCWSFSFALYHILTSATAYTRTDRPIGRFSNQKMIFAVDFLSAVFWFACFISLARFTRAFGRCEGSSVCGTVVTSTVIAVCLCITFLATTVLTSRHMLRTRNERSEKHTPGKQKWALQRLNTYHLQRRLSRMVLWWRRLTRKMPSWKQTSRKFPSWTKHPLITDSYARLQEDVLPTVTSHIRLASKDIRIHASTVDWPSAITLTTVFSLYLIFVSLYIHWFIIFIHDLEWFAYNGVDSSSWSFGQIVSISVWAEPLCEYLHLEIRGMTRGFEHRLWGYKLVKIQQPDAERGVVSDITSSARPLSPNTSLDGHEMGDYGTLGVVETPDVGRPAQDDKPADRQKGDYSELDDGDLAVRSVPRSRDGSEETDGRESVGEWQTPETVVLRSGSTAPF